MAAKLLTLDMAHLTVEEGSPPPEKLVDGSPQHRTWNAEDTGDGLYAGIWESTPGEWRIDYTEWEFCHIVEGRSVITEDGGEARTLVAGDSFIIRPGFRGRWKVVERTVKHYVVKL